MDEYCKKHGINTYTFINDNSTIYTAQQFASIDGSTQSSSTTTTSSSVTFSVQQSTTTTTSSTGTLNGGQSFVKVRSLVERGYKFVEKKFNLTDFLANSNALINNMSSYNSISSSFLQNPISTGAIFPPNALSNALNQTSVMSSSFGSTHSINTNPSSSQSGNTLIALGRIF